MGKTEKMGFKTKKGFDRKIRNFQQIQKIWNLCYFLIDASVLANFIAFMVDKGLQRPFHAILKAVP